MSNDDDNPFSSCHCIMEGIHKAFNDKTICKYKREELLKSFMRIVSPYQVHSRIPPLPLPLSNQPVKDHYDIETYFYDKECGEINCNCSNILRVSKWSHRFYTKLDTINYLNNRNIDTHTGNIIDTYEIIQFISDPDNPDNPKIKLLIKDKSEECILFLQNM